MNDNEIKNPKAGDGSEELTENALNEVSGGLDICGHEITHGVTSPISTPIIGPNTITNH